jgi:hypothetical protein
MKARANTVATNLERVIAAVSFPQGTPRILNVALITRKTVDAVNSLSPPSIGFRSLVPVLPTLKVKCGIAQPAHAPAG